MRRLFSSLALFVCVALVAGEDALEKKISVDYQKTSLASVLKDIQSKTGQRFAFAEELIGAAAVVELNAKDVTAGELLRQVFWPRGLELIRSEQGLAAVVSTSTDMGMVKSLGRALRTFVRLEAKLEQATVSGDELKVPGWLDADDEALCQALADCISGVYWFEEAGHDGLVDLESVERMSNSADADVRAGAAIVFELCPLRVKQTARVTALLRRLAQDPEPVARGCWLTAMVATLRQNSGLNLEQIAKERVEVRAGALFGLMTFSDPALVEATQVFRNDPAAMVRVFVSLLRMLRSNEEDVCRVLCERAQQESHPLVRALVLWAAAWQVQERKLSPAQYQKVRTALASEKDPFLRLQAETVDACQKADASSVAQILTLLSTDKASHQMLGLNAMLFSAEVFQRNLRKGGAKADLTALLQSLLPLLKGAQSKQLAPRLLSAGLSGVLPGDEAFKRLQEAVSSRQPLERIAAWLSLAAMQRPLSGELKKAALQSWHSPLFGEYFAGALILGASLPATEVLDLLEQNLKSGGGQGNAQALLQVICQSQRELRDEKGAPARRLVNLILESKNVRLQVLLGQALPALAPEMLKRAEPEALEAALKSPHLFFRGEEAQVQALLQRVEQLCASSSSALRATGGRILSRLGSSGHWFTYQGPVAGLLVLLQKLDEKLSGGTAEEVAVSDELVCAVTAAAARLWPNASLPDYWRQRVLTLLGKQLDARASSAAWLLLESLLQQHGVPFIKQDPALLEALSAARKQIASKGSADQQLTLWRTLARCNDKDAIESLSAQLLAGQIRTDLAPWVIADIPLSGEPYAKWLAARILDTSAPLELREQAFYSYCRSRSVEAFALARKLNPSRDQLLNNRTLQQLIQAAMNASVQDPKRQGPLFKEAVALSAELGLTEGVVLERRLLGLQLYGLVATPDAAPALEKLVLDAAQPVRVRTGALSAVFACAPASTICAKLLVDYDKLSAELRAAFGRATGNANSADAGRFLLRCLSDKSLDRDSINQLLPWISNLQPELEPVLTELKNDPATKDMAQHVLQQLAWRRKHAQASTPVQPAKTPPRPPVGNDDF